MHISFACLASTFMRDNHGDNIDFTRVRETSFRISCSHRPSGLVSRMSSIRKSGKTFFGKFYWSSCFLEKSFSCLRKSMQCRRRRDRVSRCPRTRPISIGRPLCQMTRRQYWRAEVLSGTEACKMTDRRHLIVVVKEGSMFFVSLAVRV